MSTLPARASTVQELERLLGEFFAAVSFGPGEPPRYGHIATLFSAHGMLVRNTGDAPEFATVAEFVADRRSALLRGDLTCFREAELDAVTEHFGSVAHRFSSYAKEGVASGVAFRARGVVATQFVRTPAGWKISSMAWDDERPSG